MAADEIEQPQLGAERAGAAMLMVDLDNLKKVNDQQGHDAGDGHLRAASNILREAAGPSAVIARIGGDEFAVLLAEGDRACRGRRHQRRAGAESTSRRVTHLVCAGDGRRRTRRGLGRRQRRSNAAMYAVKRCRRAAALQRSVTAS
jgi:diguanylate cyclase